MFGLVLMLAQFLRIGEAAVPGPSNGENDEPTWGLGACNPTGLASKASQFADMPPGIYAISETHLSCRGKPRFLRELKGVRSPFRFSGGADAKLLNDSLTTIGGNHTGVGFLTTLLMHQDVSMQPHSKLGNAGLLEV